ncbi:tetratricopeptide repeat protein [Flectobacillus roseus]|jgi:tetratricopeptide (TPR) repeat protein|uniref:tetratricopeptide repeat protein n=1 Tax=Flectobacillus roseus TaxID=502259 RepID=UPI0014126F2A|nr:tetratricopeptide repeat protein [Flectobacillus roseus]MDI9871498.1 tetratricopeptide repeat protein [Flectobacillus roseus]NBA76094.1 tetratricopeptide repeat protein [Emticicia sp. ODNR4P]
MKKLIFTLFLLLSSIIVTTAQDVNTALRYLKIANTLREVKQFDQSEEYLNKALGMVRGRNEYWEAAIYENLGFLYRDQENILEASRNFAKAIDIYKKLKMGMSEKAISQLLDGLKEAEELYAGIDIGSKGVKLSIIGVTVSPKKGVTYNLKKSMSINTEPSALTPQAIKETAIAIKDLVDTATVRNNVLSDRMFIVMSSGLKQATDKQPGKEAEVIAAIREALKNPNQKIDIISAEDEAKFGALSMVAPELHLSSSVMDIGGGNIKGGYLLSRTKFEAVNFPYGTKAFVKIVKKKLPDANLEEYTKGVNDEVKVVGEELALELNRKVGLKNRKNVFLLGGIVFVMNSFLHPERAAIIGRPVEVSLEDIRKFRQMSASSYEELINPDFSRVTDPAVRAIAEEDVKNITTKIYNQQDIIAGAALLETLIKEMNRDGVQKRFYFIKGGDVAWISGYVFKLISDEYQARKE